MAFVYELPYKTTTGKDVAHLILGDWQVNGIFSAYRARRSPSRRNGAELNMPGNSQTANLNGDYKVLGKHGSAGTYFDPASFSQPQGVVFGNTGRNQFRGPGYWNIDFSLFRAFPIGGGRKRVEFRAEVFNLLNTRSGATPTADDRTARTFGQTLRRSATGTRDAGTGERQIRFGVRFQF